MYHRQEKAFLEKKEIPPTSHSQKKQNHLAIGDAVVHSPAKQSYAVTAIWGTARRETKGVDVYYLFVETTTVVVYNGIPFFE